MAFQPPADHQGPLSHLSSFDNPLLGSAEPCDDSIPDLLGDSFQFPLDVFWAYFPVDVIDFDHSFNAVYPFSSLDLRPTHHPSLSTPIPVPPPAPAPAPAPAPRLCSPSTQAYSKAHDIASDQAPDYHASPNAGMASLPCGIIRPSRIIGVNAYPGLPKGLSGSGEDDGFHVGSSGYRQPTSESHPKFQNWNLVAKQPMSNLNSANPGQHQNLYGACHPNLAQSSSHINNTPTLPEAVLSSLLWQPVGVSGHGSWTDHGNGSLPIQEYVDESTNTQNQWSSPQENIYGRVIPFCEGHDGHGVDRESTGCDRSVGFHSPLDGCGSLLPYSTSRTPELGAQTPSLSTNVTTPESTGNSGPPTPEPSLPESRRKGQSAILQFVQYTAGSDTGGRTSKKRLAYDEEDQDALRNIVTKDTLRDQEGTMKDFKIVFHHREKTTKKGPAVNEPLFINRETVFQLADFSKPDVGVIKLKLTQKIGDHRLVVHGNILKYINLAKKTYLHTLEDVGGLTWEIVSMAMEYAETNKGSLVDTALDLWVVCRMIEDPWELLEGNELGVSRVDLPGTRFHGKIPIPPMMDTQLDQVIIQFILNHLRGKLIGLFEKNIKPAKPETWFETFLASFILLTHIERLAAHSVRHAETHTMPTKYSNTQFLEQAFNTAKIILSRFHYACNGSVPLGLEFNWKASHVSSMAKLGPKEVEFMQRVQNTFKERVYDLRKLPANYEYEAHGHWYHQLFIEDWDTSPVDVKNPYE
ncbi:unnamed protein product [Sordaria macrospora k-hell]|uniref:WGS project CABT00000000 data, contig 2.2 n=1 Tax=Sordaria macrospora (strain ATCC MYA-333 / DSM 997 / K(L3346) / K-hell) TaxID=771870 RepID=F7VN19_SORMK|nr:uncharacterized protein SMAC_00779 [Sordaria macrospora k-hell]CCC06748.1 unnamed protein product [Sordaria macrospora k-hell]